MMHGNTLLCIETVLTPEHKQISRTVYGVIGVIGDLGGVKDLIIAFFGFFLYSVGEQGYNLKFIKSIFIL